MTRRFTRRDTLALLAGTAATALLPQISFAQAATDPALSADPPAPPPLRVVMIGKAGDTFYDGARQGGEEAVAELGNIELTYLVPGDATNQAQIKLIEPFVVARPKEKIDAILIAANDPRALAAVCRRALRRKIKVISFHTPVAPEGRTLHVASAPIPAVGAALVQMMADAIGKTGEVAIVSTSATDAERNQLIAAMMREWVKPDYSNMKLATTLYSHGDAYANETDRFLQNHSSVKGIVALASIDSVTKGAASAGGGKVKVTGIARPSAMQVPVAHGVMQSFTDVNPVDLGYAAMVLAARFVKGESVPKPTATLRAGRLGDLTVGPAGEAALPKPFVFDKSNIEKFAAIF